MSKGNTDSEFDIDSMESGDDGEVAEDDMDSIVGSEEEVEKSMSML